MSYISESIPDLLGGVSQLAPQRRAANEVESMVNCQPRPAEGVTKRPPTQWIAEIASSSSAYTGAFVHAINKNASERFWVVLLDGDLKVFNATDGTEVTVTFPDGKAYLDVVGTPNETFRLATFNDTTVIVNREFTVAQSAELSSSRGREALITVKQSDYYVTYRIFALFVGAGNTQVNPALVATVKIGSPQENPAALDTTFIASSLNTALNLDPVIASLGLLSARVQGNNIHITPGVSLDPNLDFIITTEDGLSDNGLFVTQGAVQSVEELPAKAPVGYLVKVEGNAEKTLDDVFYEFTDSGAWKERTQDDIPVALDPATLPLELVANPDFTTADTKAQVPTATEGLSPATQFSAVMLQTKDGSTSTRLQQSMSPSPNSTVDKFWNLASAGGGTVKFNLDIKIDATKLVSGGVNPTNPGGGHFSGDGFSWEIAVDLGAGFVVLESEPIDNWQPTLYGFTAGINIALCVAGSDVRFRVTSNSGNKGSVVVTPALTMFYDVKDIQRLSFPDAFYAPNTALTATINGTAWAHTFTAGGTRAALLAELKTDLEAYGGTALTATIVDTTLLGGYIDITNDNGTDPTLASFTFDDGLTLTTQLFNGGVNFTTLGLAVGDSVRNLQDSSSAVITVIAATIVTTGALSGGVNNVWGDDDDVSITKSSTEFICRRPEWAKRTVGTVETNKWPSFLDGTINEVAFLKNRLVFLSDENVAMSEVDEFFNYFRSSTIDVLDSDRIDVALAGNKASALHSAFTWNETLLTWSELGQFVVNGEPFLSPNTVRREATTAYINTRKVRPVTSERAVYFLTEGNEFCQLWDYMPTSEDATSAEGNRISVKVPRYMPGTPRGLLAVSDPEVVLVLTATNQDRLYVLSHLLQDQERQMASWHEWRFSGVTRILGIGSIDNEVSLILERDDGKVHLEVLDLWELSETTVDAQTTNGDPAGTPVFNPTAQTTRTNDTFTEASDSKISDHTASPTSAGAWLVPPTLDAIGPTTSEMWLDGTLDRVRGYNNIASSVPGCRVNFNDTYIAGGGTDLHIFGDFNWSGHQGAHGEILAYMKSGSTDTEAGIRLRIASVSTTNVSIKLDSSDSAGDTEPTNFLTADMAGGLLTISASRSHAGDITAQVRYGVRVVLDIITVYTADAITGANEVTLYTGTLVTLWKNAYRTSLYGFHGLRPTATVFQTSYIDNFFFASGGATVGTTYDTPLGDAAFTSIVGIETDGTETVMVNNEDGTVTFPTDDKTGVDVVIGIPVASSVVLTQLYHRKNFGPFAGQPEMRGATYISLLLLGLLDTTSLTLTVDITGHVSFTQTFAELNSLDAELFHCMVGGRNTEVTITISDSTAANFKLVGLDWEGTYFNRMRRLS